MKPCNREQWRKEGKQTQAHGGIDFIRVLIEHVLFSLRKISSAMTRRDSEIIGYVLEDTGKPFSFHLCADNISHTPEKGFGVDAKMFCIFF